MAFTPGNTLYSFLFTNYLFFLTITSLKNRYFAVRGGLKTHFFFHLYQCFKDVVSAFLVSFESTHKCICGYNTWRVALLFANNKIKANTRLFTSYYVAAITEYAFNCIFHLFFKVACHRVLKNQR